MAAQAAAWRGEAGGLGGSGGSCGGAGGVFGDGGGDGDGAVKTLASPGVFVHVNPYEPSPRRANVMQM